MDAMKNKKDWDSKAGAAANNAPVGSAGQPQSKSPFESTKAFQSAKVAKTGLKNAAARRMQKMQKDGKKN